MALFDSPRLIADIGSTFARFALETAPGVFSAHASLRCDDHADFRAAVQAYLDRLPPGQRIEHAAVAIANPVEGDRVHMTNYHWEFSIERTRLQLQLDTLVVVNDFTALAMSLPRLQAQDLRQVGGGQAVPKSVIGLIGAGTGLGVSGLIPAGDSWVSLGSEGGHASVSPHDEREIAVLRHAWRQFDHVSFERLLSGAGLALMYQALAERAGQRVDSLTEREITRRALDASDALCAETLDLFCALLGTAAANLAVTLGAGGGIYIGGAIVPQLGAYFERSPFRARFEDKGRFSRYLAAIPTFVITAEQSTFTGASAILDSQLRALQAAPGSAILSQIRRARGALSPAELRVAEQVLAHPRTVLNLPIVEIARAAQVSQPTVIRFCRSLGCEGLSDFKLRLASGLTGTVPITHVQVTHDDSMVELGTKVLGNTASAILQVRSQLNREMIDRTVELLAHANRVEFFTVGQYGGVAVDAQFKFLRFGIPSAAHTDPRLQALAAAVLKPGDVAVIISGGGRLPDLLALADTARAHGAAVVAITASQSPLARKADTVLAVDHPEDAATQVPMVSRILQLLMIDILTVGVALRRPHPGAFAEANPNTDPAAADGLSAPLPAAFNEGPPPTPGVSTASPLARMTLHSR
jgi:glucokinase